MPQLDPTSFSSQLFWLTVSFVVLYILLARFLLPRVQSVIALRARTVEADIEQAQNLQSEAQRVQDAYEKTLAEGREKAKVVIENIKDRIAAIAQKQQEELDRVLERKLADSDAGIRRAKQDVMGKLMPVAGGLAERIVEIVVNHKPNSKELESAMSDLDLAEENAA